MCDHNHGSGHGGCSHEAESIIAAEAGTRYDMCSYIDFDKVTVLNEALEGSGKLVFKSMEEKSDRWASLIAIAATFDFREKFVNSDCDAELLFNIPFTGHVRLTGITISGDEDESHPGRVRLFKDREAMSFDNCSCEVDQEIDLKMDADGTVDYPLKASKFNNISHLSIFIDKNFGADETRVYYIGLRGEFQHEFRQRVAIATYEARAQMKDHKGEIPDAVARTLF